MSRRSPIISLLQILPESLREKWNYLWGATVISQAIRAQCNSPASSTGPRLGQNIILSSIKWSRIWYNGYFSRVPYSASQLLNYNGEATSSLLVFNNSVHIQRLWNKTQINKVKLKSKLLSCAPHLSENFCQWLWGKRNENPHTWRNYCCGLEYTWCSFLQLSQKRSITLEETKQH